MKISDAFFIGLAIMSLSMSLPSYIMTGDVFYLGAGTLTIIVVFYAFANTQQPAHEPTTQPKSRPRKRSRSRARGEGVKRGSY